VLDHRWNSPCRSVIIRGFVALLIGVCGYAAPVLAQPMGPELPLAIQRIVLPPERAAKELEKVGQGAFLLMPLADFEARLERLRKLLPAREETPRLTEANYTGELIDRSFQSGSGEWTVQHNGARPAVFLIDPLNLALARVKWKNGDDALLGELNGKSLGLVVGPGNVQLCRFDWSLRGSATNDGIHFVLAAPACPITTFELTLPADQWLSVSKGAALTGPHAGATPDKRVWKIQLTGMKTLELTVRKIAPAKGAGLVLFARTQTTEHVTPERIEVEQDFQIDILHGSIDKLFLEGDAELQPYEVVLKNGEIKGYQWNVAKKDAKAKPLASPPVAGASCWCASPAWMEPAKAISPDISRIGRVFMGRSP